MNFTVFNQRPLPEVREFNELKNIARHLSSTERVAKQIEGLFVEMMFKSMRSASLNSGLIENEASKMFISLHDQQIAQEVAINGQLGFADLILSQLADDPTSPEERRLSDKPSHSFIFDSARISQRAAIQPINVPPKSDSPGSIVENFISRMLLPAIEVGRKSGIPHQLIMAQAALESGWGGKEILTAEGKPSHNIFAIKSTPAWTGDTTEITTTEYINGQPQKFTATFRVYSSYTEAFNDYMELLIHNPRYRNVLYASSPEKAAKALQSTGYASDPHYAEKLISIINKIKNNAAQITNTYKKDIF